MAACVSARPPSSCICLSSDFLPYRGEKPISLSCSSSFPKLANLSLNEVSYTSNHTLSQGFVVQAAWTRRSRHEAAKRPDRKSWKQRTDMYMRPFLLDVFLSKRFVHAKCDASWNKLQGSKVHITLPLI